jgi:hypothetical protein
LVLVFLLEDGIFFPSVPSFYNTKSILDNREWLDMNHLNCLICRATDLHWVLPLILKCFRIILPGVGLFPVLTSTFRLCLQFQLLIYLMSKV